MKKKPTKSTFAWIMEFAGQKRSRYVASVLLAILGAAFQMLPYFVMARIIQKLLGGERELAGYLTDCLVMAAMWCARVLFHSLSTSASHRATFAVLGKGMSSDPHEAGLLHFASNILGFMLFLNIPLALSSLLSHMISPSRFLA